MFALDLYDFPQKVFKRSEQFREVRIFPVNIERSAGEDDETTDDGEAGDGKHEAENIINQLLSTEGCIS